MNNPEISSYLNVEQISSELRIRPDIYVKIVTSFANSLGGKMQGLNDALAVNNRDLARMILHEIKGTAGNLRLHNVSAAENVLHVAVKAGEEQRKLNQHFEQLRLETERLQQYIQKVSGQQGA